MSEKRQRHGRVVALHVERGFVQRVQLAPVAVTERAAGFHRDLQTRLAGLTPLLPDVFPLFAGEAGEKRFEMPVAAVVPVKLPVEALKPACVEGGQIVLAQKIDVHRRQPKPLGFGDQRGDQQLFGFLAARQQPRSGHGRVGRGTQQFGIVVAAGAFEGVGPGKVEHEFAVRVALQIRRGGSDQLIAVDDDQMMRLPAVVAPQAAVFFHATQKGVAHERIAVVDQRIPLRGVDAGQIVEHAKFAHRSTLRQR